jgi:NADP-dependent 3-hydroxy acid dehydrogenase YdfG
MSASTLPLNGRVAVVTGASSGIGEATARLLSGHGAKVAVLARRAERLEGLVAEITKAGGTAVAVPVDVTDQASVDAAAERVGRELGRVDLLFNNAGVMLPGPIEERKTGEWEHMIDLNVTGLMHVIGAFVPALVAAAAAGATVDLINTSSIAGQYLYPNFAVYSATKAYVSHLSRHLRLELGPKDVRVSMLEPGIVATELQSHVTDQGALDWLAAAKQTMAWLQPQDIAEIVAFTAALPRHVNLQQVTVMPTRQGI